jgi:hypothetical protein
VRTHNNIPLGGSPRYLFIAGGIGIMAILANVSVLAGTGGTDRIGVVTNLRVSLKVNRPGVSGDSDVPRVA